MRIGIALGGGGAKGLAHIAMLEALDELGLKPACVTGTSIGAVIGVMYCAGIDPHQMRQLMFEMTISKEDSLRDIVGRKNLLRWFDIIDPEFNGRGFLSAAGFMEFLFSHVQARDFSQLTVPLRVVAADFWRREEYVFDRGPLAVAVQASMALPGVFAPIKCGERVLIDGGAVNPVPYDLLPRDCEMRIAIDVMGRRADNGAEIPNMADAVLNTFQIMQKAITREKLRNTLPDIYVEPDIVGIRTLDFYKARDILAQAATAKEKFKRQLAHRIERRAGI